jgi:hypothetical protein
MSQKAYLIEIYKVESDKYSKTREIHWRLNIAIWTMLVLAIYAKNNGNLIIGNALGLYVLSIAIMTIHLIFIYHIHGSLKRSLNRMRNIANSLLNDSSDVVTWDDLERINPELKLKRAWEYLQAIITFILLLVFHYFIK